MIALKAYALDANVFIEAKRRYYAFDLCPGFWDALLWYQREGRLGSIDRVRAELERGHDDLTSWVKARVPESCFASTDNDAILAAYGEVIAWVQAQSQFFPEAKAEFVDSTDGWLIAYAKATGAILVTHEVLAKDIRREVKIPNVCEAVGVPYRDTFEMLKALGARFTWQPPEPI
jgi:hypothetical protein